MKDEPSGLMEMGVRFYDPSTGRFGSRDPIAVSMWGGDPNVYRYARNCPILAVDPRGLQSSPSPSDNLATAWGTRASLKDVLGCDYGAAKSAYDTAWKETDPTNFSNKLRQDTDAEKDALLHCIASCELARDVGPTKALVAGYAYEGATGDYSEMDYKNNKVGTDLSSGAGSCGDSCRSSLDAGNLTTEGY